MLFRQLFDLETSTYTYLIADLDTREAALVDPVLEQVERDHKLLQELGLTLLIRGCGRTDFQGDDAGMLYERVTGQLWTLPGSTQVYSAHDYRGQTVSTIAEEKQFDPRFLGRTRDEFIAFMNSLDLLDPKKIMEAAPANEHCRRVLVRQVSHLVRKYSCVEVIVN